MAKLFTLWQNPGGDVTFKGIEGTVLENDYGLDLFIHHSTESYGEGRWWYVIEASSGAAFSRGHTGTEAVDRMMDAIVTRGVEAIKGDIKKCIGQHGFTPDHRAIV